MTGPSKSGLKKWIKKGRIEKGKRGRRRKEGKPIVGQGKALRVL